MTSWSHDKGTKDIKSDERCPRMITLLISCQKMFCFVHNMNDTRTQGPTFEIDTLNKMQYRQRR